MTWRQAFIFVSVVIALGGLGLLAMAASAARAGVMSAAIFIAACGLVLIAAVPIAIIAAFKRKITSQAR